MRFSEDGTGTPYLFLGRSLPLEEVHTERLSLERSKQCLYHLI